MLKCRVAWSFPLWRERQGSYFSSLKQYAFFLLLNEKRKEKQRNLNEFFAFIYWWDSVLLLLNE
jgi:hypothetical protein